MRENAVSIPTWILLAFAGWTLLLLMSSVGVYRWSRILTGRASVHEWRADAVQGCEWYQRAMRAHMNCVENLPIYGAVAFAAFATDASAPALDALALAFLGARIGQSLVHIGLPQTERVAILRFALFFAQVMCMASMGVLIAMRA